MDWFNSWPGVVPQASLGAVLKSSEHEHVWNRCPKHCWEAIIIPGSMQQYILKPSFLNQWVVWIRISGKEISGFPKHYFGGSKYKLQNRSRTHATKQTKELHLKKKSHCEKFCFWFLTHKYNLKFPKVATRIFVCPSYFNIKSRGFFFSFPLDSKLDLELNQ